MNQREREQQHGIHTLCESLCLSVYLPGNNYRINKAPNIPRSLFVRTFHAHYLSARLCQSFYLLCQSVYLCPFTFTLSLILTVMIWGMVSCVYFLSITRSSTERSYNLDRGSSQNMKKKPTGILYLLQFIVNCCTEYLKTQNRNLLVICIAFES